MRRTESRNNRPSNSKGRSSHGGSGKRSTKLSNARICAYEALKRMNESDSYAQNAITKYIDDANLSEQDKAFATKLVLGITSTAGVLNDVLNSAMNSPDDVKADVRCALQIPVFEMLYLKKSPHASVSQGVELAAHVAPKARGLANAVLRKVVKIVEGFPYGDVDKDRAALARSSGVPRWLAEYALDSLGDDDARTLLGDLLDPAPIYIHVNLIKCSVEEFLEDVRDEKIETDAVSISGLTVPGCFKLKDRKSASSDALLKLIDGGKILISDASAQFVSYVSAQMALFKSLKGLNEELLSSADGAHMDDLNSSFLELCAGRATKSIMIQGYAQALAGQQIKDYVTLDNLEFKTSLLKKRCSQYGVHIAEALTGDATDLSSALGDKLFDTIFIDAPCSGLGTLRRHPEITWKASAETIKENAEIGCKMLISATKHLESNGCIIYSTCTFSPHEDESLISAFMNSRFADDLELVDIMGKPYFKTPVVKNGPDIHFCCALKRKS